VPEIDGLDLVRSLKNRKVDAADGDWHETLQDFDFGQLGKIKNDPPNLMNPRYDSGKAFLDAIPGIESGCVITDAPELGSSTAKGAV